MIFEDPTSVKMLIMVLWPGEDVGGMFQRKGLNRLKYHCSKEFTVICEILIIITVIFDETAIY